MCVHPEDCPMQALRCQRYVPAAKFGDPEIKAPEAFSSFERLYVCVYIYIYIYIKHVYIYIYIHMRQ